MQSTSKKGADEVYRSTDLGSSVPSGRSPLTVAVLVDCSALRRKQRNLIIYMIHQLMCTFFPLSVVFFFTMQAMARLSFLLSEQRITTSKLHLPGLSEK